MPFLENDSGIGLKEITLKKGAYNWLQNEREACTCTCWLLVDPDSRARLESLWY